jgi:diguanylate cyclase (GGDEF)-like protein
MTYPRLPTAALVRPISVSLCNMALQLSESQRASSTDFEGVQFKSSPKQLCKSTEQAEQLISKASSKIRHDIYPDCNAVRQQLDGPEVKTNTVIKDLESKIQKLQGDLADTKAVLNLYAAVVENFPGGIILTDKNLNVVVCNEQQKRLLNYSAELFVDHTPSLYELFQYNAGRGEYGPGSADLHVAEKIELVRKRIPHVFERVRPDGTVIEVRGVPIHGGGFVTTYIDITERRKSEALIYNMAFSDGLTKLSNRVGLTRSFENFAARAQRGEQFALHYIDLDNFKPVNDSYGHGVGDLLLQEAAKRLKSNCREVDTISRYGGDEFVVLQASIENVEDVEVLANRLSKAMREAFSIGDVALNIGCSIGAVCSDALSNGSSFDSLISIADREMYKSKAAGKGGYYIYHKDSPRSTPIGPTDCLNV